MAQDTGKFFFGPGIALGFLFMAELSLFEGLTLPWYVFPLFVLLSIVPPLIFFQLYMYVLFFPLCFVIWGEKLDGAMYPVNESPGDAAPGGKSDGNRVGDTDGDAAVGTQGDVAVGAKGDVAGA